MGGFIRIKGYPNSQIPFELPEVDFGEQDEKGINTSRLSPEDRKRYDKKIKELRAKNKYFNFYYDKLDNSQNTYYVTKINKATGGSFYPRSRKIELSGTETTYYEEFFHAYQSEFYGQNSMLPVNGKNIPGAVNKEAEAEVLTFLFGNDISVGGKVGGTPMKEGTWDLLNFALDVFGNKENIVKIKPVTLSKSQKEQYLRAVKSMQQANMNNNVEVYKSSMLEETPEALLFIIKKAN